ncbi:hypothetical protein [Pseudomonas sp. JUb96]|uniref:hypothetical protein n=1 Tax=Pseudomonas sp. JUb96 TaxID=2940539 RepID=UPI00222625E1|nr:hypothetical protein [Pseudomonas sp. JUb96]MCW2272417.1 hypothetical protein [Pseudomonas sp. JUb96]
MYQPPEPSGVGHCLCCNSCIDESDQVGGICYECQPVEEGKQPAFPVQANEYAGHGPSNGITIRDYFAAKAMQGFMANDALLTRYGAVAQQEMISPDALMATAAYSAADAMIAERSK